MICNGHGENTYIVHVPQVECAVGETLGASLPWWCATKSPHPVLEPLQSSLWSLHLITSTSSNNGVFIVYRHISQLWLQTERCGQRSSQPAASSRHFFNVSFNLLSLSQRWWSLLFDPNIIILHYYEIVSNLSLDSLETSACATLFHLPERASSLRPTAAGGDFEPFPLNQP